MRCVCVCVCTKVRIRGNEGAYLVCFPLIASAVRHIYWRRPSFISEAVNFALSSNVQL